MRASFIKGARKALIAAPETAASGSISVSDHDIASALDELLDERNALTRVLLEGKEVGAEARPSPTEWPGD